MYVQCFLQAWLYFATCKGKLNHINFFFFLDPVNLSLKSRSYFLGKIPSINNI